MATIANKELWAYFEVGLEFLYMLQVVDIDHLFMRDFTFMSTFDTINKIIAVKK